MKKKEKNYFYNKINIRNHKIYNKIKINDLKKRGIINEIIIYTTNKNGIINVFSTGIWGKGEVYIAEFFVEYLTLEEIEAVILHEEYHLQKRNYIKAKIIYFICLAFSFYISYKIGNGIINKIAIILLLNIFIKVLINYYLYNSEYMADKYSLKASEKEENMIFALRKLKKITENDKKKENIFERFLYRHPPIDKRIEKLQRSIDVKKRTKN